MFDEHDVQVLQIIIGGVTAVILAYLTYLTAKVNAGQKEAAVKAEEVKQTLASTASAASIQLSNMSEVGLKTHELVNSAMLEQKRIHMEKCEAAEADNPTPGNKVEARLAREAYERHKSKQDSMDLKMKKPPQSNEGVQ